MAVTKVVVATGRETEAGGVAPVAVVGTLVMAEAVAWEAATVGMVARLAAKEMQVTVVAA